MAGFRRPGRTNRYAAFGTGLRLRSRVAAVTDCLFCRMVAGEIPADVVHQTDRVFAFRDINPQAPTHVLVIPKEHHPTVGCAGRGRPVPARRGGGRRRRPSRARRAW